MDDLKGKAVNRAREKLGISVDDFQKLSDNDAQHVIEQAQRQFVLGKPNHWWWEHYKKECLDILVEGGTSQGNLGKHLLNIVPPGTELVWTIVERTAYDWGFNVYKGHIVHVQKILADCCFGIEYQIVPMDFSWLIGWNHHGVASILGDEAISWVKKLLSENPDYMWILD